MITESRGSNLTQAVHRGEQELSLVKRREYEGRLARPLDLKDLNAIELQVKTDPHLTRDDRNLLVSMVAIRFTFHPYLWDSGR